MSWVHSSYNGGKIPNPSTLGFTPMPTPEDQAREAIDALLTKAGWIIQDTNQVNLSAALGVVIRNFPLAHGHGYADYLFYLDGKAAGVIEAKRKGATLTGVEIQSAKYSGGFPPSLPVLRSPAPLPLPKHRRGNPLHQ